MKIIHYFSTFALDEGNLPLMKNRVVSQIKVLVLKTVSTLIIPSTISSENPWFAFSIIFFLVVVVVDRKLKGSTPNLRPTLMLPVELISLTPSFLLKKKSTIK